MLGLGGVSWAHKGVSTMTNCNVWMWSTWARNWVWGWACNWAVVMMVDVVMVMNGDMREGCCGGG